MLRLTLLVGFLFMGACASHRPILASADNVKVSREEPPEKCKMIGKLTGSTATMAGTQEQALEDLKRDAANKGANFVVVKQFSDYGTAVTGIAYECP